MDGISAAASVFAIVSLTIQLAEGVNKLHTYLHSLENVSEDMKAVKADLEVLVFVLEDIRQYEELYGPHAPTAVALMAVESQVSAMTAIIESIESGFQTRNLIKRRWETIKAKNHVMKFENFKSRLHEAKASLLLSQQISSRRLLQSPFDQVKLYIENIKETRQMNSEPSNSQGSVERQERSISSIHVSTPGDATSIEPSFRLPHYWGYAHGSTLIIRSPLGSLYRMKQRALDVKALRNHLSSSESLTELPTSVRTTYCFIPSLGLSILGLKQAITFSHQTSVTGVCNMLFSMKNLIPDSSLIFEFCLSGNIDGVRTLLERREASVSDVDSEGRTPLHYAVLRSSAELCRYLLDHGADLTHTDMDMNNPFNLALNCFSLKHANTSNKIDTLRIVIDIGEDIDEAVVNHMALLYTIIYDCSVAETWQGNDYLSTWFLRQWASQPRSLLAIQPVYWWTEMLSGALRHTLSAEPLRVILKYCPAESIEYMLLLAILPTCTPTHYLSESIKTLIESLDDVHYARNIEDRCSKLRTPTSVALMGSRSFYMFRNCLQELSYDLEDFADKELAGLNEVEGGRWTSETLKNLFAFQFQPWAQLPPEKPHPITCRQCGCCAYITHGPESVWIETVCRIKEGVPLTEAADVNPYLRQRAQNDWTNFFEEQICRTCSRDMATAFDFEQTQSCCFIALE